VSLAAGTPIGKYVIRRKIAEGGMAEIYLASSRGPEGFEKEVVIKRIRSFLASEPGFVEMFIAEARLASRLNHANLVQIFDFDKHEDTYYLAMEYVRGRSLLDARKRAKEQMLPMAPLLVAHVGAEVARGLFYAHRITEKGRPLKLVHRDVTPHNVLLSFDGAVKLTDFGVAKAGINKQTASGILKGKFAYMSPEQARGEEVDARTDVFALGIVLWEMLTGGRLFDADTDVGVLRAVQERMIPRPARLNPEVPEDLDAAVMRALERDLPKRFQSAGELERALAEVVLRNARTLEDRDVGAYLRKLFPEDADEERREVVSASGPTPVVMPAEAPPVEAPLGEPTSIQREPRRPQAPPSAPAPSPDEDVNASTVMMDRSREEAHRAIASLGPPTIPIPRFEPPGTDARAAPAPDRAPAAAPSPARWRVALGALALLAVGSGTAVVVNRMAARAISAPPAAIAPPNPIAIATADAGAREEPRLAAAAQRPDAGTSPAPAQAAAAPGAGAALAQTPAARPDAGTAGERSPAAAPAPKMAMLVVTAIPYASVYVDGRLQPGDVMGTRQLRIPAGKHRVRLMHEIGSKDFDVTLAPGEKQAVSYTFIR